MVRKGVSETANQFGNKPSSRLEGDLKTDEIMKAFLIQLTQSEATDGDALIFKEAANQVLNDKGMWEKIKDYSLATDLIGMGLGEANTKKKLVPAPINQAPVNPTKNINVTQVIEGTPTSSTATTNKLQK